MTSTRLGGLVGLYPSWNLEYNLPVFTSQVHWSSEHRWRNQLITRPSQ